MEAKTLKIKKPGTVPPPNPTQEVAAPPDAPTAEPTSSGVVLPRYAQAARQAPQMVSTSWTWPAIVATVAVIFFAILVVVQLLELNFFAQPPSCWSSAGMF